MVTIGLSVVDNVSVLFDLNDGKVIEIALLLLQCLIDSFNVHKLFQI